MSDVDKPADIFDRESEWSELTRFARYDGPGATLGIVSGRRRQGKTYLLDALIRITGGLMITATEATAPESLREFGEVLAGFRDEPVPYRFQTWDEALTQLFAPRDRGGPVVVVIDEFPYLVRQADVLPSLIQRQLEPAMRRRSGQVRLLLCGSAMSFMGRLLAGGAPLRGRASLELVVPTFDFRTAAMFWEISDPRTAVLTNAVVGGTPAYRREFSSDDTPAGSDDFDSWVTRTVLNPARPLFREARYLLAEEPDLRDTALYHSVLAAIASGNASRGGIANYLERPASDLAHPLGVLEDAGLISKEPDVFRANRSAYRVAEPLVTFYHAIMRPAWGQLERPGRASTVWRQMRQTFASKVVGPHFERICRDWAFWYAAPETFGGHLGRVGSGVVNDPARRIQYQIDVVVLGSGDDGRTEVLGLGEAKWNTVLMPGHLDRLLWVREMLRRHPTARSTEQTKLALFSGAGFSDELRAIAAESTDIVLVGLDRLYHGD